MECNKDEALRAKEIADRKFNEKDYIGAKKFIMKAQNLYPGLDSLQQMLTTLDVYISSQKRVISGEVDWYSVLGVSPMADEETVKKQYRKLALALHPDKNKCPGADGAFQLVSEAWSLLSDRDKRMAYNVKLNQPSLYQRDHPNQQNKASPSSQPSANGFPTSSSSARAKASPSSQPSANGFPSSSSSARKGAKRKKSNSTRQASTSSSKKQTTFTGTASEDQSSSKKTNTFWTICNQCKTQYEYLRVYLNHTLLCPNCNQPFLAEERAPPPDITKPQNQSRGQKHQNSKQPHDTSNNASSSAGRNHGAVNGAGGNVNSAGGNVNGAGGNVNGAGGNVNGAGGNVNGAGGTFASPKTAKKPANATRDGARGTTERDRSRLPKRAAGVTPLEDQLSKKSKLDESCMNFSSNVKAGPADVFEPVKVETEGINSFPGFSNVRRELSPVEIRNIMAEKARCEISKLLQTWSSREVTNNLVNNRKIGNSSSFSNPGKRSKDSAHGVSSEPAVPALMAINVPDSDFYDFDLDRTESSFDDDQVWAAYDEKDGMPRYYARVHKVISVEPFKMKISWLNSRSTSEFSTSLDWVGSRFHKTCGDFRIGKHEINGALNAYSHKVKWTRGSQGMIRILPAKGDIWALYRNWSPDWNRHTPAELIRKYDMVEVLDDYDEEQGISIVPLVKVNGFKTVFTKQTSTEVRRIPKEEMFRFSHQVPHHLLTGEEAENAPKGFWELDPAATPLELLQVTPDDEKIETCEINRQVDVEEVYK
ncbi:DnaJ homolog subfamily B member 14 [Linum perenne]